MALQFPNQNQSNYQQGYPQNYQQGFDNSPYSAPQTNIETYNNFHTLYNDSKIFSLHGRIGRIQFILYPFAFAFLVMLISFIFIISMVGLGAFLSLESQSLGITAMLGGYFIVLLLAGLATFVFLMIHTIRRLNDINRSGWFSLLMFLPMINVLLILALWLIPGTNGENDYGLPPEPPSALLKVLAVIILTLNLGSVFAGMAVVRIADEFNQVSENTEALAEAVAQAQIEAQNQNLPSQTVEAMPAQVPTTTNNGQQLNTETIVFTAEDLAKKSGMPVQTIPNESQINGNVGTVSVEPMGGVPSEGQVMPMVETTEAMPIGVAPAPSVVSVPPQPQQSQYQSQPQEQQQQQQGGISYHDFVNASDKPIFTD